MHIGLAMGYLTIGLATKQRGKMAIILHNYGLLPLDSFLLPPGIGRRVVAIRFNRLRACCRVVESSRLNLYLRQIFLNLASCSGVIFTLDITIFRSAASPLDLY